MRKEEESRGGKTNIMLGNARKLALAQVLISALFYFAWPVGSTAANPASRVRISSRAPFNKRSWGWMG